VELHNIKGDDLMFYQKFIGIRDIHEEKILEGELVKFKTTTNKEELEGIVYFNTESASFKVNACDIDVEFSFDQVYDIEII